MVLILLQKFSKAEMKDINLITTWHLKAIQYMMIRKHLELDPIVFLRWSFQPGDENSFSKYKH